MKRRGRTVSNLDILSDLKQEEVSFEEAARQFFKHCKIKGLSHDTVLFYQKELKQLRRTLVDVGANVLIVRSIKTDHIEDFIENQLGLKRAISTINCRLRAGRTFMEFCLKKNFIDKNPFDNVSQLKARHEVGATLNKRQLEKLLKAPNITEFVGLRDLAIMSTFAYTGIRLKELSSLRTKDISFDGKGEVVIQQAKNRYGRRIPMTKRLRTILKAYMGERGVLDTDALFVNVENQPINPRTIQERIKYYGNKTGVSKQVQVSPHVFRRTFCRLKVESGVNLFVLQRLTGHSDLEMLKRYVQIYGKDLEMAIEQGF
ncbi:tyrosine-type recombinase/integrase [Bacillus haikouensis]|uniref:tyrosine-type recombinase/integrase n=1 Tax=Bacillus haikouensis TaxID=1510468 RepID=UPI0015565020|nr:tyrosine-type recombinase/integrase [Bacillus haikouensis]NQD64311.1 tyrosine-type recombinase/integrase [Bacillus haikouensis]